MKIELEYRNGKKRTIYSSRGLKFNGLRPISFKITIDEIDTKNIKNVLTDILRVIDSLEIM